MIRIVNVVIEPPLVSSIPLCMSIPLAHAGLHRRRSAGLARGNLDCIYLYAS